MKIKPADTEPEAPDYKGNKGWIIVAYGIGGRAVVVDYDASFGAFCYMIDAVGGDDPEELGLDISADEDPGVYKGQFEVWTTSVHDYDGSDNDMGFNLVGELVSLWEPTSKEAQKNDT